jgi:hypothetical protein
MTAAWSAITLTINLHDHPETSTIESVITRLPFDIVLLQSAIKPTAIVTAAYKLIVITIVNGGIDRNNHY